MNRETPAQKIVKREEVMKALRECAEKVGHPPAIRELNRYYDLSLDRIRMLFGSYTKALRAAGLEPARGGIRATMEELFTDWAQIVRQSGRIPSAVKYGRYSRHSIRPLMQRFGGWRNVPHGMLQYAEEKELQKEWGDVVEIARKHCQAKAEIEARAKKRTGRGTTKGTTTEVSNKGKKSRIMGGRRVYGASMMTSAMAHAPMNEAGVLFFFGMVAQRLGFVILWVGTEFPDIEAMREVAPGKWQHVKIELEFMSRSFLKHMHKISECDLIVCWENNWADCPIEVIELKGASGDRVIR